MAIVVKGQTSLQNAIRREEKKLQKDLESQKRKHLLYSLIGGLLLLSGVLVTFLLSVVGLMGILLGLVLLLLGLKNYSSDRKYLDKLRKGLEGEQQVSDLIKRVMPDTYRIVNDIRIPYKGGTTQIDHVVIGPQGILNIETKNWSVESTEKNGRWTIRFGNQVVFKPFDPMKQSKYHEQAIRSLLEEYNDIPQSISDRLQILTAAVFTDPSAKVKTTSDEYLFIFTNLNEFADHLEFYKSRQALLLEQEVEYLTQFFKQTHFKGTKAAAKLEVAYDTSPVKVAPACSTCGKKVSEKVERYCLQNSKRFAGKIYCYEHQKGASIR